MAAAAAALPPIQRPSAASTHAGRSRPASSRAPTATARRRPNCRPGPAARPAARGPRQSAPGSARASRPPRPCYCHHRSPTARYRRRSAPPVPRRRRRRRAPRGRGRPCSPRPPPALVETRRVGQRRWDCHASHPSVSAVGSIGAPPSCQRPAAAMAGSAAPQLRSPTLRTMTRR